MSWGSSAHCTMFRRARPGPLEKLRNLRAVGKKGFVLSAIETPLPERETGRRGGRTGGNQPGSPLFLSEILAKSVPHSARSGDHLGEIAFDLLAESDLVQVHGEDPPVGEYGAENTLR
ncbi:MAG: hypothetical protein PWP47_1659 [Synergistaceae bacterium]|nr:hypothetical protein [Synergistaceae bacterium]